MSEAFNAATNLSARKRIFTYANKSSATIQRELTARDRTIHSIEPTWTRSTMDTRCRAPCCRYVFLQRQLHHVVTALLAQRDLFDGKRVKSSEISIEIFGSFFEDFMFLLHYNVWVLYIYFILFYFISDFILYIYFFLLV